MLQLESHVQAFFGLVAGGDVEIYNEFSLQHEFGIHLRSLLPRPEHKIQFERSVQFFGIDSAHLTKKEIDISVFSADRVHKIAIELKFPRSGQYPEQMFKACQDLAFLEELVTAGFDGGLFLMAADDRLFYEGSDREDSTRVFGRVGRFAVRFRSPPVIGTSA